MKILQILSLLLVALVSMTSAQCRGGARPANCAGGVNVGIRRRGCIPSAVWAYDGRSRQCRRIVYLGCGGNRNRWCSLDGCNRACRR
ncbi:male accessory gland serine protease inhibitor-like [Cochliomyia hominivorax]